MSKSDLRIDWATHAAAKYACENWHYSGCLPSFKLVKIGVWEGGKFVGVVIFSMGAAPQAHCPYHLQPRQVCELTRVALTKHKTLVSRIVAIAIRLLKKQSPGIRLIVSYADPEQDHHGGIYQAGNWVYEGKTKPCEQFEYTATGKRVHTKTIKTGRRGYATELKRRGIIRSVKLIKHKYLMPLDDEMRKQIEPLRKPYPKRVTSADSGTLATQAGGGGAIPTVTL